MAALEFSTVTISGRAIVRVLPWVASAWSARLMLKLLVTSPKEMPPAGEPALLEPGRAAKGRLTTLPPSGRPVAAEIGKSWFRFRPVLFGEKPLMPTGSMAATVPSGSRMPA